MTHLRKICKAETWADHFFEAAFWHKREVGLFDDSQIKKSLDLAGTTQA